jgi:CIC family chloride channel protein
MEHATPATTKNARQGNLLLLAGLALLTGAATGLITAIFRLALQQADGLRDSLLDWAHGQTVFGIVLVVACSASACYVAAGLVRRYAPQASGSGIPHVEAVLHELVPPAPYGLVPVKFVGGVLAIGAGLALGREGPSVQMGSSIAFLFGRLGRLNWPDCRVLIAAGAGAGLATAFNAPIAGAVFVLEELVQRFEPRIAVAALASSATAIAIARMLLGDSPDFHVGALSVASSEALPLFVVLGCATGLLGIVYNGTLLATIAAAERLTWLSVEMRAGLIGAGVGGVAWFVPDLVGGGDAITQRALIGDEALTFLPLAFLFRFALSIVSYAAGTPGGLFAPLLALGAQFGLLVGGVSRFAFPGVNIQPEAFALVGMAALLAGVVRSPVTGIVLVTEMSGNVTMLLPMLAACFGAMLVPTFLRSAPIYDSLREMTLSREKRKS